MEGWSPIGELWRLVRSLLGTTLAGSACLSRRSRPALGHASIQTTARYLAELRGQADDGGEVLDRHRHEQRRRRGRKRPSRWAARRISTGEDVLRHGCAVSCLWP